MPCGLQQSEHFGSEGPVAVQLLKLMPRRNELARELEHSHQTQQSQHAQHLDIDGNELREIKRRNRDQIDQRIKAEGVAQARPGATCKLWVHRRGQPPQHIFHGEDAHRHHIEPMEQMGVGFIHLGYMLQHHGAHAEHNQKRDQALDQPRQALLVLGVEQPVIEPTQETGGRVRGRGGRNGLHRLG